MPKLLNAKTLIAILAAALGGVAFAEIPDIDQYDRILELACLFLGGVLVKRPGDSAATKAVDK